MTTFSLVNYLLNKPLWQNMHHGMISTILHSLTLLNKYRFFSAIMTSVVKIWHAFIDAIDYLTYLCIFQTNFLYNSV